MSITEDRPKQVVAITALMVVLTTLTVALRLIGRILKGVSLGADDYMVLLALILFYPLAAGNFIGVANGLGQHFLDNGTDKFENFWKNSYWTLLLYSVDVTVTKFSILLLYQRIFPVRWLRTASWILGSIAAAWCISTFIAQIFSCTPIKYYWDFFIPGGGRCIKLFNYYISTSALNTAIDVAILSLPITIVHGLQMPLKRKVMISGIFLLGGLVCMATILRCYYFSTTKISDVTWTSTAPCILTVVEPGLGIICACLPAMPSIFNRATWSRISSLPILRTVYARSSEKLKRTKSSKHSAGSNRSHKVDPKVNVLITSPAEAWKWRTMSAMQHAEDGSHEQKSMV